MDALVGKNGIKVKNPYSSKNLPSSIAFKFEFKFNFKFRF